MSTINEEQFLELYDKYITKIYRYIYFRVGSKQVAQDLSSEVFLRTWNYLKQGKDIGNFSAMVYQVCRNIISDYFRNISELPISLESISEKKIEAEGQELTHLVEKSLEIDKIKQEISRIKPEYQDLIIWHYIEDFSVREISEITEKSEGSIRTSLSRALAALRRVMEEGG
ncbi:MAG: RNA polymerase sigma factor [Candidatus Portnoybacteria bacterium]|nr:RNA polymerase sigma factor [Candidatus Portnoybacteria bacterium]